MTGNLRKSISIQGMTIHYSLLESISRDGSVAYGVLVETEDERVSFSRITPSMQNMQALLDAMVRGAVTPVTTKDVIEDWLLR